MVRMWPKCKSIDYYTIQPKTQPTPLGNNYNPDDDIMKDHQDLHYPDGCPVGYNIYLIQATVGSIHTMDFSTVCDYLQRIEYTVRNTPPQNSSMKNSLLSGRVSIYVTYLQPQRNLNFNAPEQIDEVAVTRDESAERKILKLVRNKIKVMYAVGDPFA